MPEDQVLYGTPRKKPVLEVSPSSTPPGHASKNFHLRSPFSEASTRATSSSLCPKVVQTVPLVCAAVARLAIVFNRATLRCSVRGFEKLRMNARSKCGDDLSEWEGRCAKLESLVTRQVAWRVGAEKRLLDLATRGEKLEKQRDLLRRKYKASQSALDAEERRVTRLRTALAEAEEASEVRFGQALELRLCWVGKCLMVRVHNYMSRRTFVCFHRENTVVLWPMLPESLKPMSSCQENRQ